MTSRRSPVRASAASLLFIVAVLAAIAALFVDHRVSRNTLERSALWREQVATIRNESSLARLAAEKRAAGQRADLDAPLAAAARACDALLARRQG